MNVCVCVCVCMCGWNMICPARVWNQLQHTHTQERYTLYSTVTMEMLGSFKGLHLHNGNCIYRCRPAVIHIKCSRLKLSMTNHGFSQLVVTVCMFDQEISEVNSEQYLKVCKLCRYSCRLHYINFRRSAFAFSVYKDNCVIYKSSRYNWWQYDIINTTNIKALLLKKLGFWFLILIGCAMLKCLFH